MNENAVQQERGPRKKKTELTSALTGHSIRSQSVKAKSKSCSSNQAGCDRRIFRSEFNPEIRSVLSPSQDEQRVDLPRVSAFRPVTPKSQQPSSTLPVPLYRSNLWKRFASQNLTLEIKSLHMKVLYLTLRRTLANEIVRILKPNHQVILLENSWGGLFLLNLTQWQPDFRGGGEGGGRRGGRGACSSYDDWQMELLLSNERTQRTSHVITTCQILKPDSVELGFLETILILRQMRELRFCQTDRVDTYLRQIYIALSTYISQSGYGHNSAARFSHLLISLHQLQLPERMVNFYFFGGRVTKIQHLLKLA